ncbi:heme peroxidase [Massarina eburnea CBS 473.64]|uniref:Heme peroxidase n=1 Tax=Massarina eburnea CBS 473.64 TaxID=1395130 RepID=A0A6A6RTS6_9PLEO|nr:heme peroxidase [Massarina eburnea CBS 473.64]
MALTNGHSTPASDVPTVKETIHDYIRDFKSQLDRLPQDVGVVKSLIDGLLTENVVDDRKLLLEDTIKWASSYPKNSPTAGLLTNTMLANLWNNLKHPPLSYMGDTYRYRMADGSHNNIMYPDLGKSGSYYARSVVPQRSPTTTLPDPGDVFDALFARHGLAKEHPAKFSSIAISLATIIIHDIFRTSDVDPNIVKSSSYLDLGPLYGHDQDMQNTVRTFQDGKLKPDTFAEPRILGQPAGVGALLVSFNRFHNYVVTQLAEINENGRFTPSKLDKAKGLDGEKAEAKRDNDLFQTGRLITCGLYVNIILRDYVRVILNLNRSDTAWTLDPRDQAFDAFDKEGIPKGVGNQVSMEFNLIYRWHATISNKNEAWVNDFMKELWPGQEPSTITQAQLYEGFKKWGHSLDTDPSKWTFGGLKRNEKGGFEDAGLVGILSSTTEDLAGAFGARNVPTALRAIEILGINQGRNWGTASLNEVRKFFKLKPHATFEEINPDPDVAASLRALYHEPDNVELYPGLVCEDTKELQVPGSGLCAGLTVAKAILSDAVSLVRGDRYYTVDHSPANLTSFGFNEIASDPNVGFGTTIYRLLQRAYPGWYRSNSVYALFPLTIPSENRAILAARGLEAGYDYDRPTFVPQPVPILSWSGAKDVLKDQESFKVPWGKHVGELINHDWMLSGDKPWNAGQKKVCLHALYDPVQGLDQIRDFYNTVTDDLVKTKSIKLRDRYQIDLVRDVAIPSHAIVTAHIWGIPLKDDEQEKGVGFTPTKLYEAMANVFWYTFLDIDAAQTPAVRVAAKEATDALATAVTSAVIDVYGGDHSYLKSVFSQMQGEKRDPALPEFGPKLIQRLFDQGLSLEEVVWTIVPTSAAAAPIQTQGISRLLDFYLSPERAAEWADIQAVATSDSPEALESLRKYALEGFRLDPAAAGALRVVAAPDAMIQDGERTLHPSAGSTIFVDVNTAGLDPSVFQDPLQVKLDRPDELYIHHGYGGHQCLGQRSVMIAMAVQLRVFARLKNLRRAAGPAGQLKSTTVNGAFKVFLTEDWSQWTPFPSTWRLYYDE